MADQTGPKQSEVLMADNEYVLLYRKAVAVALADPSEANLQHACSYAELADQRVAVMGALSLTSSQYESLCKGGPKVEAQPTTGGDASITELVSRICDREVKIHSLEVEGTKLSVEQGNALLALKEKIGHGKWEAWWQFDEASLPLRSVLGSKKTIENHMRLAKYASDHPEVLDMKLGLARIACGIYRITEVAQPAQPAPVQPEPKIETPAANEPAQAADEDIEADEEPATESEQTEPQPTGDKVEISVKPRLDEEKWFDLPPVSSHRDEGRAFPLSLSKDDPDIIIDGALLATALSNTARKDFGNAYEDHMKFKGSLVQIEAFPEGVMRLTALGSGIEVAIELLAAPGLLEIRRYFRGVFPARKIYQSTLTNTGPICMTMVYDKLFTANAINTAMTQCYREFAAAVASQSNLKHYVPTYIIEQIGRIEGARDAFAKHSQSRLLAESIVTAGEYGLNVSADNFLSIIARMADEVPTEVFMRGPALDNATHLKLLAHLVAVIEELDKCSNEKARTEFLKEKRNSRKLVKQRRREPIERLTMEPGPPPIRVITQVCDGLTLTVTKAGSAPLADTASEPSEPIANPEPLAPQ